MATFVRRGKKIVVVLRIAGTPSTSKTFDTLRDAKRWALDKESELRRNINAVKQQDYSHVTLGDALIRYREEVAINHRAAQNSIVRIDFLYKRLPVDKPLNQITKYQMIEYRDQRIAEVKGSTVFRDMNLLSAFFNHAIDEWGYITENPLRGVTRPESPPHRDRIISDDEIEKMIIQLKYERGSVPRTIGHQVAIIFLFALETGMRLGEICDLTWENVFLDKKYVKLTMTKNGTSREVPLSNAAHALLTLMMGINEPNVFISTRQTLDAYFRKARKMAGLDGFTFHDTRHTAATRIATHTAQKLPFLAFCKMFGWKDPKKAMIYYNLKASDIAALLD